jgi:hypothetical protein
VHRALLDWLRRERYAEAALWVLADNHRSRAWYESRGWHADGATSLWSESGVPLPEIRLRQGLDLSHRQQRTAGAAD